MTKPKAKAKAKRAKNSARAISNSEAVDHVVRFLTGLADSGVCDRSLISTVVLAFRVTIFIYGDDPDILIRSISAPVPTDLRDAIIDEIAKRDPKKKKK